MFAHTRGRPATTLRFVVWIEDNWQFLVAVAIALPSIVALWFQRRKNTLDYRVTLVAPILSPQSSTMSVPLEITYNGQQVSDPFLVRIRVENTGKHAVRADDYVKPITVRLRRTFRVYDTFISRESTRGIVDLEHDKVPIGKSPEYPPHGVALKPKLMNPRDWFEVQITCEGEPRSIDVSSRYANQSRPMKRMSAPTVYGRKDVLLATATLIFGVLLIASILLVENPEEPGRAAITTILTLFVVYIALGAVLITRMLGRLDIRGLRRRWRRRGWR